MFRFFFYIFPLLLHYMLTQDRSFFYMYVYRIGYEVTEILIKAVIVAAAVSFSLNAVYVSVCVWEHR